MFATWLTSSSQPFFFSTFNFFKIPGFAMNEAPYGSRYIVNFNQHHFSHNIQRSQTNMSLQEVNAL